ncbi:type II toxin-antitoxin system HipA family toxin [Lampropedia puyangensis]|uniref:Type II toxin-antitoxin system HipA family toxin n=2 Tax=Lampropedia puyangensis TaxID=1330072 RepID=A0A4S8F391_9BURK|nr:HipA domain-containing protein [Lampropedia puyangensis]THT99631.1 type II toxin-antitoxin system HipA family toxin [Lampropedia puyangensis]
MEDGSTHRHVQWFFDNLLPEEQLRSLMAKEARIPEADAFALLAYLGSESAGALSLLPPDAPLPHAHSKRLLTDDALSARIRNLPRISLTAESPKRMSLAGAQHKLLVIQEGEQLFEPEGATASTAILKPEHDNQQHYACSVINGYVTMRIAQTVGLQVPNVYVRYVPEPVYLIERFDRNGSQSRLHTIDASQLLGQSRSYKYTEASLSTLVKIASACAAPAIARQRLFLWLVFNTLMGNNDAHLKNLSFMVSPQGFHLSPHYDLLCTAAYETKALSEYAAHWPQSLLTIALPGASTFADVRMANLLAAGEVLGIKPVTAKRMVQQLANALPVAFTKEKQAWVERHQTLNLPSTQAAEHRVLNVMEHMVLQEMLQQIT